MRRILASGVVLLSACSPPAAAPSPRPDARAAAAPPAAADSLLLEALTWPELRDQIAAGRTTILVPVGGVEQNGPAMALGKHDARVSILAVRIARALGDALVAPVVSYVPEGSLDPPTAHMRFPGTITVPSDVFRQTLESAAGSFRLHGFKDIVFLGDHGGYQADLRAAAAELNRRWAGGPARAHYAAAYYGATQSSYVSALKARGYSAREIGVHAGLADTSLTLALAPALVRVDALRRGAPPSPAEGVSGDPRRSTAALGQLAVDEIIGQTVREIRADTKAGR